MKNHKLTIYYDNYCPRCTQFSRFVENWDWLGLITIKQLRNPTHIQDAEGIEEQKAQKEMASFNGKWAYGFRSIFRILVRIPVLWPFLPLFFILKITGLGQVIYQQFAINRRIIPLHCNEDTCEINRN